MISHGAPAAAPTAAITAERPHPGWHVLLVGMMATGKSTLGRLLAERLGRYSVDTDEEVVRDAGRTVSEIFAAEGEAAFRLAEKRALAEAVATPGPAVISVGGGVVLDPENRRLIARSGQVVWLRARPETLAQRVGNGHGRPLLEHDPAGSLHRLGTERHPLYEEVAHLALDVDDAGPDELVERLADALVSRLSTSRSAPAPTTCSSVPAPATASPRSCPRRRAAPSSSPRRTCPSRWRPDCPPSASRSPTASAPRPSPFSSGSPATSPASG